MKSAVVEKYIRDTIDRTPNWDVECFDTFSQNGVCSQRSVFLLYNFMRNPSLRTGKAKVGRESSLRLCCFDERKQDRFFENQELLTETLSLFDLKECTLFEALHVVFGHALSLPGEAQKIDRAMNVFGAAYRRSCSEELRESNPNPDAFYVLSFAMVMLNSDLHNPAVKQRMSVAQFKRNLEGVVVLNDGGAESIYMQVLRCEMVEGSYFAAKISKPVWIVRHILGGYKRSKRASVTICAGELVIDGTDNRFSLRGCCIARSTGGS